MALSALAWLQFSGCGIYSTKPGQLPDHIKTIAITTFDNLTPQPNLDQEISNAIVTRFVADNNLRVVDEADADAVLSGAITRYSNAIFGFTADVNAEEYRVSITVSAKLFDKVKNREVWKDENLTRTSNYYVVEVPGQVPQTELTGRDDAIRKIAEEVISRTIDVW